MLTESLDALCIQKVHPMARYLETGHIRRFFFEDDRGNPVTKASYVPELEQFWGGGIKEFENLDEEEHWFH